MPQSYLNQQCHPRIWNNNLSFSRLQKDCRFIKMEFSPMYFLRQFAFTIAEREALLLKHSLGMPLSLMAKNINKYKKG